jgi:hypothetical protein
MQILNSSPKNDRILTQLGNKSFHVAGKFGGVTVGSYLAAYRIFSNSYLECPHCGAPITTEPCCTMCGSKNDGTGMTGRKMKTDNFGRDENHPCFGCEFKTGLSSNCDICSLRESGMEV